MTENAPVEYAYCGTCGEQLRVPTRYMSVAQALDNHRRVEHG